MTSVSENVYIDKLDDAVGDYNNKYHRTIKMKPVYVKNNTYIDFKKEVNDKDPKYKVPWTYVINDLNGEELLERFMKKNYKRLISKNLR